MKKRKPLASTVQACQTRKMWGPEARPGPYPIFAYHGFPLDKACNIRLQMLGQEVLCPLGSTMWKAKLKSKMAGASPPRPGMKPPLLGPHPRRLTETTTGPAAASKSLSEKSERPGSSAPGMLGPGLGVEFQERLAPAVQGDGVGTFGCLTISRAVGMPGHPCQEAMGFPCPIFVLNKMDRGFVFAIVSSRRCGSKRGGGDGAVE